VAAKAASVADARGRLETVLEGADAKVAALKARLVAKKAGFKGRDPLVAGSELEGGPPAEPEGGPATQSGEPPVEANCAVGEVRSFEWEGREGVAGGWGGGGVAGGGGGGGGGAGPPPPALLLPSCPPPHPPTHPTHTHTVIILPFPSLSPLLFSTPKRRPPPALPAPRAPTAWAAAASPGPPGARPT